MKIFTLLSIFFISLLTCAQEIRKENLSKQKKTYWDFKHTQVQSSGKYFVDEFGETIEKHGKWTFYDRLGNVEEVRNYYRDVLAGPVVLFYSNGKKRQEGFFKNGSQDSLYLEWYETGKLKTKGTFKLDEAVNKWYYYYQDGRLKAIEEAQDSMNYVWEFYLPDSLHTQTVVDGLGELTTYYTTGQVKEWYNYNQGLKNGSFEEFSIYGYTTLSGSFKGGLKDGKWEYTYYTGDLEKISHYEDGALNGAYTYYYDNGKTNVIGQYKNGAKDGEWTWYTNTGNKDMKGSFKNDLQDGDWSYWYRTGDLSYHAHYTSGLKTGEWTYFYKEGTKFKIGTFDNDLKNGTWRTWYEDETLLMEGDYVNGKEEGEWNNYWETGDLKNTAIFKGGALHGEWNSYYTNGNLKLNGTYVKDMKVGEWTESFENGQLKDVMTYKLFKVKSKVNYGIMKDHVVMESKLHGQTRSYSSKDFKMTGDGNYKKGLKEGKWIAYYPGGKFPAVISQYKDGALHGVMQQFTRRGKITSEIEYKKGLKHGKFNVFDKRGKVINSRRFEHGMQVVEGQSKSSGHFSPN
ncbi:MAG: hypothetical protein P8N52_02700 [Crocinitomicaceae bacterium]|nr:hypothetical protein [Crocinitomicaceae bacterium]MDG1776212.1 hypothetical protein [Crocinitomicaceae bacterium]